MSEKNIEQFGRAVLAELKDAIASGAYHMDAGKLADMAVECGLMQYVAFDPTKHEIEGNECAVEVGDMIYYWGG